MLAGTNGLAHESISIPIKGREDCGASSVQTHTCEPGDREVWAKLLQQIDSCHTFTSVSAPTPFNAGFGVPWNVLNPTQLLLKAFCTSSSVIADVGPTTYVYNQGYGWVNSAWQQTTFTCTGGALVSNAWCPGGGTRETSGQLNI
jgi:hypothetical protein